MDEKKPLKPSQFARLIGVHIKTVQRWDKKGTFVAERTYTNRRYYTQEDVETYLRGEKKERKHMYLNGTKLKELAEQHKLSQEALQKLSGVPHERMSYYWQYPITTLRTGDDALLATVLHVQPDDLLVKGEPKGVMLRDKFSE